MVGQSTGLPEEIRTVAVQVFENDTFEPNIEAPITRGIISKLSQDGRLKVVPQNEADGVITGIITSYSIEPISYDSFTGSVTGYHNTVSVTFDFRDLRSHNIKYTSSVSTNGSFIVAPIHSGTESSRLTSIENMGASIGSSVVSILLNQYPSTPEIHGDFRDIDSIHIRNLRNLYQWQPQNLIIHGNIEGLELEIIQKLEQLYTVTVPTNKVITDKIAIHLLSISKKINRETGVLINREGEITHVTVGTASEIVPPGMPLEPAGKKPMAGHRFIHTTLESNGVTKDFLNKFAPLGLDIIASIKALPSGKLGNLSFAYPDPRNKDSYVLLRNKTLGEVDSLYRSIFPYRKPRDDKKRVLLGDLKGISKEEKQKLESLAVVTIPVGKPFFPGTEVALSEIAFKLKKDVGYLVDRDGNVTHLIVADGKDFTIPELPQNLIGDMQLSGFRLIKTALNGNGVGEKSLNDLLKHRLDAVITIQVSANGEPGDKYLSHFSMKNFTPLMTLGPLTSSELEKRYTILHKRMMRGSSKKIPVTIETLNLMTRLSSQLQRALGVLIDRDNNVTHLITGDSNKIFIPEIPFKRMGNLQLSGYRLIRTGAAGEGITNDDLKTLNFHKLDAVIVVDRLANGTPGKLYLAHMTGEKESPVTVVGPSSFEENQKYYQSILWKLEEPASERKINGDTKELSKSQIDDLKELYENKMPPGIPVTNEIISTLTELSKKLKRQIGILADRSGKIAGVTVGTKSSISYPKTSTPALGHLGLSGLTFIHTYSEDSQISEDMFGGELMSNKYDAIVMINTSAKVKDGNVSLAHIPEKKTAKPYILIGPAGIEEVVGGFVTFTRRFEWQLESFWELSTGWRLEAITTTLEDTKK